MKKSSLKESDRPDHISAEQMEIYRATARRRHQQQVRALALRRQRAWEVARQAGQVLKAQCICHQKPRY